MGRLSCGYPICSWAEAPATRANIRTVFDLFAGRPVPGSARMALPTKIRDRIRQAAEDDLVLISFSGHGRTNDRGQFFIQKGPISVGSYRDVLCLAREVAATAGFRFMARGVARDEKNETKRLKCRRFGVQYFDQAVKMEILDNRRHIFNRLKT